MVKKKKSPLITAKEKIKRITQGKTSVEKTFQNDPAINPLTGRTKSEAKTLRKEAMKFMMFRSLDDRDALKQMGFKTNTYEEFIHYYELGQNYFWQVRSRSTFKQEYFDFVTEYTAEDFPQYLNLIKHGSSPDKAAQIVFPNQVGKALTTRQANLDGDNDDEDFRNNFFGVKSKKDNEKDEDENESE